MHCVTVAQSIQTLTCSDESSESRNYNTYDKCESGQLQTVRERTNEDASIAGMG